MLKWQVCHKNLDQIESQSQNLDISKAKKPTNYDGVMIVSKLMCLRTTCVKNSSQISNGNNEDLYIGAAHVSHFEAEEYGILSLGIATMHWEP